MFIYTKDSIAYKIYLNFLTCLYNNTFYFSFLCPSIIMFLSILTKVPTSNTHKHIKT
ncbi:hypothetical protein CBE01nite_38730 [Clostridium beijerinckii]|jgi:hypothetical protein|uniref:Uncharacterized protein n=1 Tax=Clostridium diolis TaxID=223919 RepID=A0AAV3VUQ0_9CLOT|nr:hypothetical protein CDIOL_02780 [Clostridium diolis]GEP66105.1 hypothetical protein CBE01nite_38730 [Clostridium beijerinckii]